jgi:hypothetical protein
VSERKKLEKTYFKDRLNTKNKKAITDFSFFGDLSMFADKLNTSMGIHYDATGYTVVIDPNIKTEEKNIVIENMYILEALQYAVEEYGVPYYIQGKEIHFGVCQNEISTPLKYGVDNALLSIRRENTNNKIINRITGVGSSENIPYYYPNFNESGEHEVTTEPANLIDNIKPINYLKVDPYTSLRNGGDATYYKATVNGIGQTDVDTITLKVDSLSDPSGYQQEDTVYEWKKIIIGVPYDEKYYAQTTVNLTIDIRQAIQSNISISRTLIARQDDGTIDYEQNLEVLSIKGKYTPSGSEGFYPVEGNVAYNVTDNEILVNPSILYNFGITISLKANVKIPVNKWGGVVAYFRYDTKYFSPIRNLNVKSSNIDDTTYFNFNKVIDYPNGIRTYTESLTYKVTRVVAGYSNARLDSVFRGVFLNNEGNDVSEWKRFIPNSIVVKNSKGDTISHYVDTSDYINFRNTSNARDIFTIEMSVRVQMSTDSRDTAYKVELEYIPNFGRIEKTYDYWKFHDGKEVSYDIAGIKFYNLEDAPDSSKVIFSPTINWIDPKQNLMPSKYRQTLGEEMFYEAKNNTYSDDKGVFITFPNPYRPVKRSEFVAEPKEDIKPTIVGVKNARGERIDMFADVAFDELDNNKDWKDVDEDTEELEHSFFFVKLRKTDGIDGFNLFEQSIENGEMVISMTNGHCGSCNFTIMVDDENYKNPVQVDENGDLVRDENGNVVIKTGSPQDIQQDTSQAEVWIALKKSEDDYGIILPDKESGLVPTTDDKFVITNILLPNQYITKAEERLEKELLAEMLENNTDKFEYSIDLSRIFLAENEDIANNLNENSAVTIQYNGINHRMYVSSYSYKMDSNAALPNIKIEISKELTITKNQLQTLEDKVVKKVEAIFASSDFTTTNERGGWGGSNITIVQETGYDTKAVMSQKAVTKAIEKVVYDNPPISVSQTIGWSTTDVMSQRAVTESLSKITNNINTRILYSTGGEEYKWMSQRAVTDALTLAKPTFDGIETSVKYVTTTEPYDSYDGSVVYISSDKHFAYKVEMKYYRDWHSSSMYNTTAPKALTNTIFKNTSNNQDYIFDGTDLVLLTSGNGGTGTMMTELSYSELKSLYDGANLTKGMQYRITDYVTTCNSAGSVSGVTTSSAGHQFDIIVTADTTSTLNANARVCLHEGDSYFATSKLSEWKIKYDINNDTNKYLWADADNGKGVIYWMQDEFGNETCYDFKNILFNGIYTFNYNASNENQDYSLYGQYCYENKVKGYYNGILLRLNANTISSSSLSSISNNVFEVNTSNCVLGTFCNNNTIGVGSRTITLGDGCSYNKIGGVCQHIL